MTDLYSEPRPHAPTVIVSEIVAGAARGYRPQNELAERFARIARQPDGNLWESDLDEIRGMGITVELKEPVTFPTIDPFIKQSPLYQRAINAYITRKVLARPLRLPNVSDSV